MSAGLESHVIGPVFLDHGKQTDTVIRVTPFDPRIGGYDVSEGGDPRPYIEPRPEPTFQGELVAWYEKVGSNRYAYFLVGHDAADGLGLRWIEVTGVQPNLNYYTDGRTDAPLDQWYESNCDPPWLCE